MKQYAYFKESHIREFLSSSEDEGDIICTSYAPKKAPPRQVDLNVVTLGFQDHKLERAYGTFHHQVLCQLSDKKIQKLHMVVVLSYLYLYLVSYSSFNAAHLLNVGVASLHGLLLWGLQKHAPVLFSRLREHIHILLAAIYLFLHLHTHPVPNALASDDILSLVYTLVLGSSCLLNVGIFIICPMLYKTQVLLSLVNTAIIMAHRNAGLCSLCSVPAAASLLDKCWAAVQQYALPHPAMQAVARATFVGSCSCYTVTALLQFMLGVCVPITIAYWTERKRRKVYLAANDMAVKSVLAVALPGYIQAVMAGTLAAMGASALWGMIVSGVSRIVPGCKLS